MARIISIPLAILLFIGCAGVNLTEVKPEERNQTYIFEIEMNKSQLFDKIIEWMARTYNSSKDVIQMQDKNNGKIIGKGVTSFLNIYVEIPCEYTVTIDVRDNKYRIIFENFIGLWGQFRNNPQPVTDKGSLDQLKIKTKAIADSSYSYITKKSNDDF